MGRNRRTGPRRGSHPSLKVKLFERDGWQAKDGTWFVRCAFGCGAVLTRTTATIDRHPVPGRHGGTYRLDNTRLACAPCNTADGGQAAIGRKKRSTT